MKPPKSFKKKKETIFRDYAIGVSGNGFRLRAKVPLYVVGEIIRIIGIEEYKLPPKQ